MRVLKVFLAICLLMVTSFAWAGDTNFNAVVTIPGSDDTYGYQMKNSSGTRLFSVTKDTGAIYTAGGITNSRERGFTLPLMGFLFADTAAPLSTTTTPGLEIDDSIPNIVWADGETSPVMTTFRISSDYSSGGAFRLICTESSTSTPNQVDFDVYVNRAGSAVDAAATGQTPVALGAGASATPVIVTLTPATDFTSLAAGDWVTIRIWRDDTATGTNDLEVKGVEFFYTAAN